MNMKCCNCGYEFIDKWETKDNTQVGDERFVRIDLFGKQFETNHENKDWCRYHLDEYDKVYLYGCPKCRNIMMGDWN